jgi:streptogramin lyase
MARTLACIAALVALSLLAAAPAGAAPVIDEMDVDMDPAGIATGPDGRMWITGYGGGATGTLGRMYTGGGYSSVATTVPYNYGITTDSGHAWISDRQGAVILCVRPIENDPKHAYVSQINITPGEHPAQIVKVGSKIWWTEPDTGYIGRMDASCNEYPAAHDLVRFPVTTLPVIPGAPDGIVAGPDGNIWFTDRYNNAIGKASPVATSAADVTLFTLPTPNSKPAAITVGPDKRLWFTEDAGNSVRSIPTSATIENPGFSNPVVLPTAGSHPAGITTGPDGNIWFVEAGVQKLGYISPSSNTLIGELAYSKAKYPPPGWLADQTAGFITKGPDNNLWFTEPAGIKVGRVSFPEPAPPAPPPAPEPEPAPAPTPPPTPEVKASRPRPALTRLRLKPASFVPARTGVTVRKASVAKKKKTAKPGTVVSFRLNLKATVRFKVFQLVKVKSKKKRGKAKTKRRAVGTFRVAGKRGANRFRFTGRLRKRTLKAGSYVLVATPAAHGRTGRSVTKPFKVKSSTPKPK